MPKLYQGSGYSYEFGTPATEIVGGMAIESLKIDEVPEFEAEGKDQAGSTIAFVVGDNKMNFTASGYLHDASAFGLVDDFLYDGVTFIINSKNVTQSNTDFQKCEIGGVAYAVIGDAAGVEVDNTGGEAP